MKTDIFQSCGHCWVFQICWHFECSTFTVSSFRIWNSSTGIPSHPLALFVMILSKAHLTSHSRVSGSRWVITPLWLSGLWRSFLYSSSVYSCHLFFHYIHWSGLSFPSPGDLPNPGMNPGLPHCRQTLYRLSHHWSPLSRLLRAKCWIMNKWGKKDTKNKTIKKPISSLRSQKYLKSNNH